MRTLLVCTTVIASSLSASNVFALHGLTTNVFAGTTSENPAQVTRIRNGVRTLTDSTSFADSSSGRDFYSEVTSSLLDGTVRSYLSGEGGPGGGSSNGLLISQGILFDEFTFVGSYSGQTVPFTVSLDGSWDIDGAALASSLASANMKLFAAGTVPDDDTFFNVAANAATPTLYNQSVSGSASSPYPLTLTGSVALNGTNPKIQFYFNSQIIASSNDVATMFEADFTHTSSVDFDFAPGMVVLSSSGTFPGTIVPEPVTLTPLLAGIAMLARRRSRI